MESKRLTDGIHPLKEEHFAEVIEMLITVFYTKNKIWSKANIDKNLFRSFFQKELEIHLQSQERVRKFLGKNVSYNLVKIIGGQIRSIMFQIQIYDYQQIQKTAKQSQIPLFRQLQMEGKQLIKSVDLSRLERGKHLYGTWGAKLSNKQESDRLAFDHIAQFYAYIMKQASFDSMFSRISNEKLVRVFQNLGAKVVSKVAYKTETQEYPLAFICLQLNNPILVKLMSSEDKKRQVNKKSKL